MIFQQYVKYYQNVGTIAKIMDDMGIRVVSVVPYGYEDVHNNYKVSERFMVIGQAEYESEEEAEAVNNLFFDKCLAAHKLF